MTDKDLIKSKINQAQIYNLNLINNSTETGLVKVPDAGALLGFFNLEACLIKESDTAKQFDFGPFSHIIFKYGDRCVIKALHKAVQIPNTDLLLVYLRQPLDMPEFMSVIIYNGTIGDTYLAKNRGAYKLVDKKKVELIGTW